MSNEDLSKELDHLLEILSRPLSRYILSVLAGVDPGSYTGPVDDEDDRPAPSQ
ncbi:MAG: hypothetical protein ACFFEF_12065 [Candidatus Thorarchaeota archaeon]